MERAFKLLGWVVAALLLACGMAGTASAAVPLQACVARLPAAATEAERLLAAPRQYDCTTRQNEHGPGNYAVRFAFDPVSPAAGDPLVLRTTSVWQDAQRIVFRYGDGTTETLEWNSANASRYMTIGAIFEFPVPTHAAPLQAIHIEVTNSANLRGVVLGAELMTRSESFALKAWLVALYAGFAGLSLALLTYNSALWVALGHRFQLAYCGMVASLMAYTFTSSGLALLAFPSLDNNDRLRINYVLLGLTALAAVLFVRDFFSDAARDRRVRHFTILGGAAMMVTALLFALLAPWQIHLLDRLYYIGGVLLLATVVPVLWTARKQGDAYLGLFLLAWSPPILTTAARAAYGFNLLPYSFWLDNGNLIALAVESLLSSLLIIARLRVLSSERDLAREGEQSALRLASSDPLTGLLNRRAFIGRAVGRSGVHRLMLIDIDSFKAINDRMGHDIGDEVLCEIARAIQSVRIPGSLAVRMGGEEFALLVPLARQGECLPEQVLDAIRTHTMPHALKVTASLGFADGPVGSHDEWKRLYRLADAALYRAKADGRDRTCRATGFAGGIAARA
ncbi:diguanylate cyclase [Novosphingobium sp.]|uniref:GGDEF domain-containing protein n=1 Tax=Novosphingobium sp. TaxID=1874826 RepID=UPI001ECC3E27|nr:diguanylate cyclase [Novosphingobium sp.]MBK6801541.1 diguanylate cyclase [Novosphingobium sp.]MBK9010555.1 diguanylate cyclase [Novosphingobium sp.]